MVMIQEAHGRTLGMMLAQWWRRWRKRRQAVAELESCGSDLGQIARDVGLSSGELRVIAAKRPDAADLLTLRLARLNLDPRTLARSEGAVHRDLQRLCTLCAGKTRCARDLADNTSSDAWQDYCPNSTTLNSLVEKTDCEKKIVRLDRRQARRRASPLSS